MSGKLNRTCIYCGSDDWWAIDNKQEFVEVCSKCHKMVNYKKQSFLDTYSCDKCDCKNGKLLDNDNNISIECNECHSVKIVFEKHYVSTDNRYSKGGIIVDSIPKMDNQVKCPKCGSTQITSGARGYSLMLGFIGANKTMNRCARCGYSWKPKLRKN